MIVQAEGNNVRNAVAVAKRLIITQNGLDGKAYRQLRTKLISGEDGLYRVTLNSDDIVEVTVIRHAICKAWVNPQ